MAYEMTNVNTNQIIKTSSPPLSSSSSPPSFFTITFEDGFIGMEIRNRRAVKNGAMVRKFHLNKDGRIGQAQATGKIKRYMQLLSVNDVDLTLKPFQECLETYSTFCKNAKEHRTDDLETYYLCNTRRFKKIIFLLNVKQLQQYLLFPPNLSF